MKGSVVAAIVVGVATFGAYGAVIAVMTAAGFGMGDIAVGMK